MSSVFATLNAKTRLPRRATTFSAGFDFFPQEDVVIPPKGEVQVRTGVKFGKVFSGYGMIADRSSVFLKGASVFRGLVDGDYPNEIIMIFVNRTEATLVLPKEKAMAQMILFELSKRALSEIAEDKTAARQGGFGSTVGR